MLKEILVFGDIEMGGGTLTDDFISDLKLSELFLEFCARNHPIDLVLNGDTFDFLKCPFVYGDSRSYPRHITAEISLAKLNMINNAHRRVFEALAQFLHNPQHHLYFIIGNHDHDLFFPEVQQRIRELLSKNSGIFFSLRYNQYGVYTEHGQQYDFLNAINENRLFLNYGGTRILDIPWVSFGLISRFMDLKEQNPFLERIKPIPVLFSHHRAVVQQISWRMLEYFGKSILYYPIRYYHDPTYTFPRALFREFYRRFKNKHWEVDAIVDSFKSKQRKHLRKNKINVLGHIHQKYIEEKEGWVIIHPDTWRDEYILDPQTKELVPKPKNYTDILVQEDGRVQWTLKKCPIARGTLRFEDVVADQRKALRVAAQEEGFELRV